MKTYIKRLWNAICNKEFHEPYTYWNADEHILDTVVRYINMERNGHPNHYTEKEWEDKLKLLKHEIITLQNLDFGEDDYVKKYIKEENRLQEFIQKEIGEILFNLWD